MDEITRLNLEIAELKEKFFTQKSSFKRSLEECDALEGQVEELETKAKEIGEWITALERGKVRYGYSDGELLEWKMYDGTWAASTTNVDFTVTPKTESGFYWQTDRVSGGTWNGDSDTLKMAMIMSASAISTDSPQDHP